MIDLVAIGQTLSVWALPVITAITLHEAAHGWMADRLGDDTARRLGRVSFNPVRHVDPFGTIVLPGILVLLGSPFVFGWAKPVPVAFHRLRNPKLDMVWVALAGPGINIVMAAVAALLMHPLQPLTTADLPLWVYQNLENAIFANIVLACFNMLPILPLDGGRVLTGLLPGRLAWRFAATERYGLLLVLGLAFLVPMIAREFGYSINPLAWVLMPMIQAVYHVRPVRHGLGGVSDGRPEDAFIVDLDGFEGPLDLLLDLARAHKVDLAKISILALAEQFLAYLHGVQARQLQIAAEYLVMAAWLAYLKSQLLLPPAERELTDAEAMAEDLGERLRRLEALRRAAAALQERPRLGEARFARGAPEAPVVVVTPLWRTSLSELFGAYGAVDAAWPHDQHDHARAPADDAGGGAAALGAAAHRAGLARPRFLPARGSGRPARAALGGRGLADRQPGARPPGLDRAAAGGAVRADHDPAAAVSGPSRQTGPGGAAVRLGRAAGGGGAAGASGRGRMSRACWPSCRRTMPTAASGSSARAAPGLFAPRPRSRRSCSGAGCSRAGCRAPPWRRWR